MKKNKKILVYKILLIILVIAAIGIASIILRKQYNDRVYDKENEEIVEQFHEQEKIKDKEIMLKYKEYNVIGLIKIPATNIEYPILEKTTMESMDISISRFSGGEINGYGNVSLAGHNNYSGTMFSKNKYLKVGDRVLLTDLSGTTIEYEIYDIFVTDPNDVSILETKDETIREVTLITCKNGRSNRLIIKAKEII